MMATLTQVNTSHGGMPKVAVLIARVTHLGVEGDRQRTRKIHGGPARAVCLYSEELYEVLRSEGFRVAAGDLGENFTTLGIDLQQLRPGDHLAVGVHCVIQITRVREPCRQLARWHPDLPRAIRGRSGWMARVIQAGVVRPGDAIEVRSAARKGE